MELRDILVLLRAGHDERTALAVAGDLAGQHRAFLRALYLDAAPQPTIADCFAIGTSAVNEVMDDLEAEANDGVRNAQTAFTKELEACGASGDLTILPPCFSAAEVWDQARMADLVVIARPEAEDPAFAHSIDRLLVEGGTPCLLVPGQAKSGTAFRRIVVAWNGSREAKRAIDEAMPLLHRAEAIQLLTIGDPPAAPAPHDDHAVATHLARHGLIAEIAHVAEDGGIADTVLEAARSFGADLLVMGAYGHSRTAEALLGGVTHDVVRAATLPVLLSR
jgi:nucleotide-binding universal stress UspA family protein